jgi:hypothetical protein
MRNFHAIPKDKTKDVLNTLKELPFLIVERLEPRYHGIANRYSYAGNDEAYTFYDGRVKVFHGEAKIAERTFNLPYNVRLRDERCVVIANKLTRIPVAIIYADGGLMDRKEWKRYTKVSWERTPRSVRPHHIVQPPQVHRLTSDDIRKSHAVLRQHRERAIRHYVANGKLSEIEFGHNRLVFHASPFYAHMSVLQALLDHSEVVQSEREALRNSLDAATAYYLRTGYGDDFTTIKEEGFFPIRAMRGSIVERIVPRRYRHLIQISGDASSNSLALENIVIGEKSTTSLGQRLSA